MPYVLQRKSASMTHNSFHSPPSCARLLPGVALLLCCLVGQGCNWTLPRGEGFTDEMSSWSRNLRPKEKSDDTPLGTSNKALEIERNLGYR